MNWLTPTILDMKTEEGIKTTFDSMLIWNNLRPDEHSPVFPQKMTFQQIKEHETIGYFHFPKWPSPHPTQPSQYPHPWHSRPKEDTTPS